MKSRTGRSGDRKNGYPFPEGCAMVLPGGPVQAISWQGPRNSLQNTLPGAYCVRGI